MDYENEIKKIKESISKLNDVVDALTYATNLIQANKEFEKSFKVGDRVQFKTWEEMEKEFGVNGCNNIKTYFPFLDVMSDLCGTYATIKEINGKSVKLCDFTANGDTIWVVDRELDRLIPYVNGYICVNGINVEKGGYGLRDLFKTKAEAEHYLHHAKITRTETLPFLTWEEFKEKYDECVRLFRGKE